jgi:hypothetical protein
MSDATAVSRENSLVEIEPDEVIDEASNEPPGSVIYEISSYGADYTVDSLVKRMRKGDFYLPKFQRSYVWNQRQASRFVESLLLGLPVPGIFVYKEDNTRKHLIIDGNQRLKTLQFFFDGTFREKKFRLIDVDERWLDRTYDELDESDRRTLEDAIIHTTVFRQDRPTNSITSVYQVFERLNTGGTRLYAQEIRHCVSYGDLDALLETLNTNSDWRSIYGKESVRLKDRELILRFLALLFSPKYTKPMKDFLDGFMTDYRRLDAERKKQFADVFCNTIRVARTALGDRAFRPENLINAAVFDSVMVGLARRLQCKEVNNYDAIKKVYLSLLDSESFQSAYKRATSDEDNVRKRLQIATEAFSNVA